MSKLLVSSDYFTTVSQSVVILPALLETSFLEVRRKILLLKKFAERIQIDVSDGKFTKSKTWSKPRNLQRITLPFQFETHLMLSNPQEAFFEWLQAGASQVIIHYEAINRESIEEISQKTRAYKRGLGLAINPGTPWQVIKPYIAYIDCVLVMTVEPGLQGGEFLPNMLKKVKAISQFTDKLAVEVDGGMNPKRARLAVKAGAKAVAVGSYIWEHPDGPQKAYEEMVKAVE